MSFVEYQIEVIQTVIVTKYYFEYTSSAINTGKNGEHLCANWELEMT